MKTWQKNLLTVVGVIVAMYLMVFIRVKMESAREFREAEQYYQWWKNPKAKHDAMIQMLVARPNPKEATLSDEERYAAIGKLVEMQKDKRPMQDQQALKRQLAEYYFTRQDQLKADLDLLVQRKTIDPNQKDSFTRDLGDLFEMTADIEKFKREMTYYYFKFPEGLKADLEQLKAAGEISTTEHAWLTRELTDIKEVFESDIKTAFYGYSTVLDIWLDPPGWPPSVLRNSALSQKTKELIGTREEREEARLSGLSKYPITQEFEDWVREAAPVPGKGAQAGSGKPPVEAKRAVKPSKKP